VQGSDTSTILDDIVDRVVRAAKLDVELYEEVEADETLTAQAIAVVVITAIAGGISGALGAIIWGRSIGGFFAALTLGPIFDVIGYFIWAAITYFIGANVFEGTADYGEMLRAIGYSHGPKILGVLGFLPCVGWVFSLVGWVWSLVAGVVAIRQALDFDTGKAILTCIVGWIAKLILYAIPIIILGTLGVGAALLFGAVTR
jgi:hypothetical protein